MKRAARTGGCLAIVLISVLQALGQSAPIANAGADLNASLGDIVTLDGSRSTAPGDGQLEYAWSLEIKPEGSGAALSNAASARPAFTVDVPGVYVASLVVRSGGLQESAPDFVVVTAINRPPVADAGPNLTLHVGDTAVLDGTQSFDLDFDRLSYQWLFVTKPDCSRAVLVNPTSSTSEVLADCPGLYVVQLHVTDPFASSDDFVMIRTTNSPPTADAGADQTAAIDQMVRLDGSRSSDRDADSIKYAWSFVTKPVASIATLSDEGTPFPFFVPDVAGAYRVRLIVNDGLSDALADTVIVSTINSAPVADAGPDLHVRTGEIVRVDASRSSDADGQALRFTWTFVSRPAGSSAALDDQAAVRPGFLADVPGTYVLALVVHDGFVSSAVDLVRVSTENVAPVANAGNGQVVQAGSIVSLSGAGSTDADGDELGFRWAMIAQPPGSTAILFNIAAVRPAFVPDLPGSYVIQLIVTDGRAISAPDTIVVTTRNGAPTADAGADRTIPIGYLTPLDGTASRDANGDPLTFRWSFVARPPGSSARIQAPTSAVTFFTPDVAGTYVASLTVNNGRVWSAPDAVVMTTVNSLPVANAGANQEARIGDVVTLNGTASNDADAEFLTYRWSLIVRPLASRAQLSDPASATLVFTADAAGTYVAQLFVADSFGSSAPSTVLVVASNRTNHPPVANAGADQRVVPGTPVQLDGRSSADPDGDPLTYAWTLTPPAGSAAVLDDPASPSPMFVTDLPGTYEAQLVVSDGEFRSADAVIVLANQQPTANIVANLSVTVGDTVELDGRGSSDPDGQVLTYEWTVTGPAGSKAALVNSQTAVASFVPDVAGEFVVHLVVSDGFEASDATARISASSRPIETILCGETKPGAIDGAGERDEFIFTGVQGHAVVFAAVAMAGSLGAIAELFDPNGVLRVRTLANRQSSSVRLLVTGTYKIVVHDDNFADAGTYNVNLQSSTGDCGQTIACGATLGGVIPGALNRSSLPQAQQDSFTFTGTLNDAVVFAAVATEGSSIAPVAELYDPSGVLRVRTLANRQSPSVRLPATGTYTIIVHDDNLVDGGTYNLSMVSSGGRCGRGIQCGETLAGILPAPVINGTGQPHAQLDGYTFNGTQGEAVVFAAVASVGEAIAPVAELYDPNGVLRVRTLANRQSPSLKLPLTGTYTIVVHDDNLVDGGSYNVNLQFLTGRCAAALVCGLPVIAAIPGDDNRTASPPAEQDAYAFSGTAGESVTFEALTVDGAIAPVAELYDPDGVLRVRTLANRPSPPITLPINGKYTIVVHDDDLRDGGRYRVQYQLGSGCPVPAATITPASLQFVDQEVGTTSPTQTVTITSTGAAPLSITAVTPPSTDNFVLAANNCVGVMLAPGTSCAIAVAFAPKVSGTLTDAVTIVSNAVDTPHFVPLSGTGVQTQCTPLPAGAVAWWTGNGFAEDLISPAHNGTLMNGATFAAGKVGQAFSLDGVDDFVWVPDSAALKPVTVTVDAWVNFRDLDGTVYGRAPAGLEYIVFKRNSRPFTNFEGYTLVKIRTADGERLSFGITTAEGIQATLLSSTLVVPNRFYHVAGTFDGTEAKLYVNGTLEDTRFHPYPLDLSTEPLTIGRTNQPIWDGACNCLIDEVEVFDRALAADEIAAIVTAGAAGKCRDGAITVSPGTLAVDPQPLGTESAPKVISISNVGSAPVAIASVASIGDFRVAADTCSATMLAAGSACTFEVRFAPQGTDPGARSGAITISSDALGNPHTIAASGEAVDAASGTLVVSPAAVDFGEQEVGTTSAPRSITVSNTGSVLVTIASVLASGDYAVVNDLCTAATLTAGGVCTFGVQFAPTAEGLRPGDVTITSNAAASPHHVTTTGTGVRRTLTLTPNPLNFGPVQVGTPTATQFVTVRNTGANPMQVLSFTASGDFSVVTTGVVNCSLTTPLPAGAICSIAVRVTATVEGPRTGELTVDSTATDSPHTVTLLANGVLSQLTLTPNPLNFGNVQVGTPSATQFVTVRNTGVGPLQVNSFTAGGDFSIVTVGVVNCSLTTPLPAGAICSIAVRVTASAEGTLTGELTVVSTAAGSPHVVALLATGVLPQLTLTPNPLLFGNVQVGTPSATQFVTVRNIGVGPVQVNSFTPTGDFSVVTVGVVNCSQTTPLPAGAICSIAVRVTATAEGARTGELTVGSTAAASPQVVALSATAVPPQLSLTPNPLAFANVQLGTPSTTQFVTVRNIGVGPVQVNSFTPTGDFSVVTVGVVNCSQTTPLPAGAICSIAVRVTASVEGTRTGDLTVVSTAATSPHVVALSATGVLPQLTLTPNPLAFGNVQVGTQSATQFVTVRNTGVGPVQVNSFTASGDFSVVTVGVVNCSLTTPLPAAAICSIAVRVTASAEGARTGELTVASTAANSPQVVALSATGVLPH